MHGAAFEGAAPKDDVDAGVAVARTSERGSKMLSILSTGLTTKATV
jgi:hypothetical protein